MSLDTIRFDSPTDRNTGQCQVLSHQHTAHSAVLYHVPGHAGGAGGEDAQLAVHGVLQLEGLAHLHEDVLPALLPPPAAGDNDMQMIIALLSYLSAQPSPA